MIPAVEQVIDEIRGAWRYRWVAMGIAWAVCVLGWLVVLSLPDQYRATARVYVDTQTALAPLLRGLAVDQNVDTQLNYVRQSLLSRPALDKVARETDLDLQVTTPQGREALIQSLGQRINVEMDRSRDRPSTDAVYTISYTDRVRSKSVEVVSTLLNTFVEDTVGGKRAGQEEAQRFLQQQVEDLERRLSLSEQRLADFKRQNVGMVPGEQGDYFTRLQNEMDLTRRTRENLNVALGRRGELQRQLRGEQPFMAGSISPGTAGTPGVASDSTAGRIQETERRLSELLLRFTDRHPDVIATRENLEQLKQRQQQEFEALRRGDPAAVASSGVGANPVHQSIQLQLNQTEVEIAALQRQLAESDRKVAELRRMVDTVPAVEAEFARLTRDYDVTQAQYTQLLQRLEQARLSEQADETGSIRIEVIDPPTADFNPVAPDRPLFLVAVLLAGLGAGGGAAYLLHMMRPVFNNTRSLAEITGLPVLGAVSMTWLDKQKVELRRGQVTYAAASMLLLLSFVAVLVLRGPGTRLLQQLVG